MIFEDSFPSTDAISFSFAELDQATVAFDGFEHDFDAVADLDLVEVVEFHFTNGAFAFEADLDDDIVTDNVNDGSVEDGSWFKAGDGVVDAAKHIFITVGSEEQVDLFFDFEVIDFK